MLYIAKLFFPWEAASNALTRPHLLVDTLVKKTIGVSGTSLIVSDIARSEQQSCQVTGHGATSYTMGAPRTVHEHGNWAMHVALSARGGAVLSTGLDGSLVSRVGTRTATVTPAVATQCALSEDGTQAALALRDGTVRLFDVAVSVPVELDTQAYTGMLHACGVALGYRSRAMCFTGSARHAVVISGTGGTTSSEFDGVGRGVALSADSTRVAFTADNSCVSVADANVGALRSPLETVATCDDVGVCLDALGQTLAVADAGGGRLIDLRDRPENARSLVGHIPPGRYGRIAISRDGRRAIVSERGGFGVWDICGTRVATLSVPAVAFCNGCAIASEGELAVTAASDGVVRMWRIVSSVGAFIRRRETDEDVRWWRTSGPLLSRS